MIDGLSQLIFNVYEAFTVAFFRADQEYLACRASFTFARSFDRNRKVPIEGTLPGWVSKHGEPLIIPNFDKDESSLGYYGGPEDIKSFMGYPMESGGVLVVDSKKKWAFTDREKKIMANFVDIVQAEMEREKKSQETEERLEELLLERRMVCLCNALNDSRGAVDAILEDCMSFSGSDIAFVGIEKSGRLYVEALSGLDQPGYLGRECPAGSSISSMVLDGGREFLLPFNSGYLREKPLLFPEETVRARQFFGFPLMSDETPFGVLGFVTISERRLKEQSIGLLRDAAALLSLHFKSLWMKEYLNRAKDIEPVTGTLQFARFLRLMEKLTSEEKRFALLSVKIKGIEAYNRKMGVEFTNNLLMRASDTIRYCAGSRASVTRKGGGHFYVLLRDNEATDDRNIRKIIHFSINKSLAGETAGKDAIQVESGMARFSGESGGPWDLLEKAEAAHSDKY